MRPVPPSDDQRGASENASDGVECSSCHRLFDEAQLVRFGTRLLCWGCLSSWFDDDGDPRHGTPDDPRVTKAKARYNGAPSQELLVIRKHPKTGVYQQDLLRWGLIPNWIKEANPKTKPINATAERVATAPMFRQAYAKRRCIVLQPYAIALQSGQPFGIAGIWEGWKHPETADIIRTFCIIT